MTKEKRRQRLKEHEEESAPHRAACAAMEGKSLSQLPSAYPDLKSNATAKTRADFSFSNAEDIVAARYCCQR